jgi:diaminohydroxyphosphoribosylaminopyrimidine deaminase/5-amino-6-(5-phosphoribosylamino)uracil reductase
MMVDPDADRAFMNLALSLARRGAPAPNPHVGAVVVRRRGVVGSGQHERAGGAHAEVMALSEAGARARGATLYVTLEPCKHHGRTPPCVDAVLRAGIVRILIGCRDPNPLVRGGGAALLGSAGVLVELGPCVDEATKLIADWKARLCPELAARAAHPAACAPSRGFARKRAGGRWAHRR